MRKLFAVIFFVLIAVIIAAALIYHYLSKNPFQEKAILTQVTALTVTPTPFQEKIEAIGQARANESVTITANIMDHVHIINFQDGALVKKGDILVELDNEEQNAQLLEAQAVLKEAEQHFERIKQLIEKNYVTKQQYDNQVSLVKSAEAKVEEVEARLADRVIRAPFTGVIGFRNISVGALVSPGTEITTLDEINPIKVDFTVPERYLAQVKPGMKIAASTVAYPKEIFRGEVIAVNSRVDLATRSVSVRAMIQNQKLKLKPGMLLNIDVLTETSTAILIPETAIIQLQNKKFVYLINGDNRVIQQEVLTGARNGEKIIITTGLKPNDQIVVLGNFKLIPNQQVKIMKQEAL